MMVEPRVTLSMALADRAQVAEILDVARVLDAPEIIKYWKSAPYLLNFMRHYSLKRLLEEQMDVPSATLRDAILAARPAMLDREALNAYAPLDPTNGRMRAILDDIFGGQPRTEPLD